MEGGREELSRWWVRLRNCLQLQWETWERTWYFPLMRVRDVGGRGNEREDQLC